MTPKQTYSVWCIAPHTLIRVLISGGLVSRAREAAAEGRLVLSLALMMARAARAMATTAAATLLMLVLGLPSLLVMAAAGLAGVT